MVPRGERVQSTDPLHHAHRQLIAGFCADAPTQVGVYGQLVAAVAERHSRDDSPIPESIACGTVLA